MSKIPECSHDAVKFITTQGLQCYACVPDSYKRRYPGWQERMELSARRAEQARKNFKKEVPA